MDIVFPVEDGAYDRSRSVVIFPVVVDGHRVAASVPASVLASRFHAASEREYDLLRAFDASRYIIEEIARDLLSSESGPSLALALSHFDVSSLAEVH